MTARKESASVEHAVFVFQDVKTVVAALHQNKWKRLLVQISCALIAGYMSIPNAVSVTSHTVGNTLHGGPILLTLHSFVEFAKKIQVDTPTWMTLCNHQ